MSHLCLQVKVGMEVGTGCVASMCKCLDRSACVLGIFSISLFVQPELSLRRKSSWHKKCTVSSLGASCVGKMFVNWMPCFLYRTLGPTDAIQNIREQTGCNEREGSSWRSGTLRRHNKCLLQKPCPGWRRGSTGRTDQMEWWWRPPTSHMGGAHWGYELCTDCTTAYKGSPGETWPAGMLLTPGNSVWQECV